MTKRMPKRGTNRRLFLQGVGGAVLAAPFLGSLSPSGWRGAAAAGVTRRRLIVMFTHYGCITNRWFPQKSHGELVAADYEATTLRHLAPYADKLLLPRGIRAMNEWSFDQALGQETDSHSQVMGSYFTCCPVDGHSGLVTTSSAIREGVPARKFDARPVGGRSLDHICAEQLSPQGTPLVIAIGGAQNTETANFSYRTAGTMEERAELYAATGSTSALLELLAPLFGAGSAEEASYRIARGQNVLDVARDDLMRISGHDLSESDRAKLEAWAELLTETAPLVRGLTGQCSAALLEELGTSEEEIREVNGQSLDVVAPAMLNLMVLSAVCDLNPVIFSKFPATYVFRFLGIEIDSASLSGRVGNAAIGGSCVTGVNDMLATIDDWYAQQFAALVGKLASIPEGDATLLDNCAAVWFPEMSDGNAHNLNNLPILQAGSCGGYFKTGMAVNVEDGAADLTPGNSEAQCTPGDTEIAFDETESTGTPPEFANAPINKYYCSLMNALGVQAGMDGFPALGGTAPVTHFGYYDDTRRFGSFLTEAPEPPAIDDPGEFDALRA